MTFFPIDVPFTYHASVQTAGRRDPAIRLVRDIETFALREASAEEAPVSVRIGGRVFDVSGFRHNDQVAFTHDIRRSNRGRSWAPLYGAQGRLSLDEFSHRLGKAGTARPQSVTPWMGCPWGSNAPERIARATPRVKLADRIVEDGDSRRRQAASCKAAAVMQDLMVVDGTLWRAAAEPVIAVQPFGQIALLLPTRTDGVQKTVQGHDEPESLPAGLTSIWFRADRRRAAEEFARDQGLEPEAMGEIEVETPDALVFDERRAALKRLFLAIRVAKPRGVHSDRRLYARITDACRKLEDERIHVRPQAMISLIEAVADALGGSNRPIEQELRKLALSIIAAERRFAPPAG